MESDDITPKERSQLKSLAKSSKDAMYDETDPPRYKPKLKEFQFPHKSFIVLILIVWILLTIISTGAIIAGWITETPDQGINGLALTYTSILAVVLYFSIVVHFNRASYLYDVASTLCVGLTVLSSLIGCVLGCVAAFTGAPLAYAAIGLMSGSIVFITLGLLFSYLSIRDHNNFELYMREEIVYKPFDFDAYEADGIEHTTKVLLKRYPGVPREEITKIFDRRPIEPRKYDEFYSNKEIAYLKKKGYNTKQTDKLESQWKYHDL